MIVRRRQGKSWYHRFRTHQDGTNGKKENAKHPSRRLQLRSPLSPNYQKPQTRPNIPPDSELLASLYDEARLVISTSSAFFSRAGLRTSLSSVKREEMAQEVLDNADVAGLGDERSAGLTGVKPLP